MRRRAACGPCCSMRRRMRRAPSYSRPSTSAGAHTDASARSHHRLFECPKTLRPLPKLILTPIPGPQVQHYTPLASTAADGRTDLSLCRCHSAGALLSLCFLAGAYEHAFALIQEFGTLPMGVEVLVQVCTH